MFYLYNYRELIFTLVIRELKSRYRGSFFGYLWSFFNPLLLLVIYTLIFNFIFKPRIEGISPYAMFLFVGLLPWNWFSGSLNEASLSFQENSGILKKIYIPLEIIPLVKVLSYGIHFLFAFPVLFLALYFTEHLSWSILFLPLSFLLQFLFTAFLAILVGTLGVFFKDVKDLLSNFLQFLFFATPIIYSVEMVPGNFLKKVVSYNPLTHLLKLWQEPLFYGKIPHYKSFLYFGFFIFVFGFLCFLIFKNYREEIVERL